MESSVKIKVYVKGKLVHDSFYERESALNSNRLELHDVTDLEYHPVIEGELIPESGNINHRFFCVDRREQILENNELVVIIHGNWC